MAGLPSILLAQAFESVLFLSTKLSVTDTLPLQSNRSLLLLRSVRSVVDRSWFFASKGGEQGC